MNRSRVEEDSDKIRKLFDYAVALTLCMKSLNWTDNYTLRNMIGATPKNEISNLGSL